MKKRPTSVREKAGGEGGGLKFLEKKREEVNMGYVRGDGVGASGNQSKKKKKET